MTLQQLILFTILAGMLVLFAWNRWRFDLVAMVALLVATIVGIVPSDEMFSGFGHPAVVTVAAVLALSRGLLNAGVVDTIARYLGRVGARPSVQVATLTGLVALCSGFMNNVGALAVLMPVAIWMSRESKNSPSLLLMPLAFGSLLGGTLTLIGTPPNIIIAAYRGEEGVAPFGMFDFLPVGAGITLTGIIFIALIGWRLIPKCKEEAAPEELFEVSDYITELRVPEESKMVGRTLHEMLSALEQETDVVVAGLIREKQRQLAPSTYAILQKGDVLLVRADSESLEKLMEAACLELAGDEDEEEEVKLKSEEVVLAEVIVTLDSQLVSKTAANLRLRDEYGVNILGVARQGHYLEERLSKIRFAVGDILLVQGREESLQKAFTSLRLLPLADRGLRIGKPRKVLLAMVIFGAALALVALDVLSAPVSLLAGAVVMVLAGLLGSADAYKSIDWAVIVLLAAVIPIGQALETTGGAQLVADRLLDIAHYSSPATTLVVLITGTMLLSNVINNAAAAILTAPIAIGLAQGMGISADPLLMAVAVGASCAFLTPIGHQSNALVMTPGGYGFGDYWRLGLPLSVLVVATAVPLIMRIWPLEEFL